MKITILTIGKTGTSYLKEGIAIYLDRLKHYAKVEYKELPDISARGVLPEILKQKEGDIILKQIRPDDFLALLDEREIIILLGNSQNFFKKK